MGTVIASSAFYLENTAASPRQVRDALVSVASPVVKLAKRASRVATTTRLLYTGFMIEGTP